MHSPLCIKRKVAALSWLLAAAAPAQNPVPEVLDILSGDASSPLDFVTAEGNDAQADGLEALDYLSGQNALGPLDFISSGDGPSLGPLDFISSGDASGPLDFITATVTPSFPFSAAGYPDDYAADCPPLAFPFAAEKVTSGFGYRPKYGRMHKGIDIAMAVGDTVRTPLAATVLNIGYEARGYGHYLTLMHDDGMETRYAHLSYTLVTPGQKIDAGQPVAVSGNSGNSTGPHLHFETRFLGLPVDPSIFFHFDHNPIEP